MSGKKFLINWFEVVKPKNNAGGTGVGLSML